VAVFVDYVKPLPAQLLVTLDMSVFRSTRNVRIGPEGVGCWRRFGWRGSWMRSGGSRAGY
jgi:hypothetical protein